MNIQIKKKKNSDGYKIKSNSIELNRVKLIEPYYKFKLNSNQIGKIIQIEEALIDSITTDEKELFLSSIAFTSAHGNILKVNIHKNEILDKRLDMFKTNVDDRGKFFNLILKPHCLNKSMKIEWNMEIYSCEPSFVDEVIEELPSSDIDEPPEPTPEDVEHIEQLLNNKKRELTIKISELQEKINESTIHTIDAIEELVKSIL